MKKYLLLSCFLGLFSFCHSDTAFGEATYENSGVVSFYGTYEYPTEESTTATSNSSTTTEPTKPLTEALHPSFLLAYMSRDKEDYRRQVPPIKHHLFIWESALSL
ncbi:hypothetical protein ACHLPL_14455 [Enterococcus faecalis]